MTISFFWEYKLPWNLTMAKEGNNSILKHIETLWNEYCQPYDIHFIIYYLIVILKLSYPVAYGTFLLTGLPTNERAMRSREASCQAWASRSSTWASMVTTGLVDPHFVKTQTYYL